jgi:hypothetical protein
MLVKLVSVLEGACVSLLIILMLFALSKVELRNVCAAMVALCMVH